MKILIPGHKIHTRMDVRISTCPTSVNSTGKLIQIYLTIRIYLMTQITDVVYINPTLIIQILITYDLPYQGLTFENIILLYNRMLPPLPVLRHNRPVEPKKVLIKYFKRLNFHATNITILS